MEQLINFFNGTGGRICFALLALVLMMAFTGIFYKKTFTVKSLSYTAVCLALAAVFSVFKYSLPYGGSITMCSMFFVTLSGLWFGPAAGIITGITHGFLQFVIEPTFVVHPVQLFLDYPIAFGALGLAGFFAKKRYGVYIGFIVAALARGFVHVISGVIFFSEYAGEKNAVLYSIEYNMSYILPEILLTCVIISIPAFKYAMSYIKQQLSL